MGPNASGKSAFIESIGFARDYIVNGQKSRQTTGVNQFKGDGEDLKGISSFQFLFYFEGEVYEYGFSLDRIQVHEEWLMQLTGKDLEPLFTRMTDDQGKTTIEIENALASESSIPRQLAELLKNTIRKNQLFLYRLYDNGIDMVQNIVTWFQNLQIIWPGSTIQDLPVQIQQNTRLREYLSDRLKALDTGISCVENLPQIKFNHRLNSNSVRFSLEEESDGTRRLLELLSMLFSIQENGNLIYFVDDIDRSLHTMLSRFLLDEFVNHTNSEHSQLISTAHDISLIDLNHFRQDEIWFIEKNRQGESGLKPLSNFDMNGNRNALKVCFCGRCGAVSTMRGN